LPTENHTATLNTETKEIFIFGGFNQGAHSNNLYTFNISSKSFKKFESKDNSLGPLPRVGHAAVIFNNNLYIYGGEGPDGVYYNDMWTYNLQTNQWSEVKYSATDIPTARSGHSLISCKDNYFYIFGGKTGNIQETNELWKFSPSKNEFILLHDTLLEQYTEREINEMSFKEEDDNKKTKKFKLLTKRDIPALNPLNREIKNDKNQKKEMMRKSQILFEFRQKCEKELLKSPSTNKMKRSVIYNLESDMLSVMNKLNSSFRSNKSLLGDISLMGNVPVPRDGQSAVMYANLIVIFGGDRNKFPFNDLYTFILP
jgi:hypothetical protein